MEVQLEENMSHQVAGYLVLAVRTQELEVVIDDDQETIYYEEVITLAF